MWIDYNSELQPMFRCKGINSSQFSAVLHKWVMLETQPILQPNAYKLTWHPMLNVPHQQLKHNSALTFNTNKIIKNCKSLNLKSIPNEKLTAGIHPPPMSPTLQDQNKSHMAWLGILAMWSLRWGEEWLREMSDVCIQSMASFLSLVANSLNPKRREHHLKTQKSLF